MNRPVRAWRVAALALLAASTLAACGNQHSDEFADIFGDLGDPLPTATAAQLAAFERGREVALRRFTDSDGLGPEFNVVSCRNCHERPVLGGSAGRYRDFLLVGQRLIDGSFFPTGVAGVQPQFTLTSASRRPTDPGTNVESTRNPIPMFGVGVIAALPEASILAHVDEDDADLRRPGLVPHLAVRGVRLPLLELLVHLGDERLDAVEVAVAHLVEERALLGLARERDDGLVPARPRSRSPPREGRVDAGARAGCRRGSGTRRSSG